MNLFQRIGQRLRRAWAALVQTARPPLPAPVVDYRISERLLCDEARAQGRADAMNHLFDPWSFGDPDDSPSIEEPPYVAQLRQHCLSAIDSYRSQQALTTSRLAEVQLDWEEAESLMVSARTRMADVAAREVQNEELALRRFIRRRGGETTVPPIDPSSRVWEGETEPLGAGWRALVLLFLCGVAFAIQNYVAEFYFAGATDDRSTTLGVTAAIAAIGIVGPYVSGMLLRARRATGSDRWLPVLAVVAALPALAIVGACGYVAARLFDQGSSLATAGQSRSRLLGVTPTTLVVVFTVVLFIACVMAAMLGLARRHPYQEAYVRSRERRRAAVIQRQRLGEAINPEYSPPLRAEDGVEGSSARGDHEQAIWRVCLAAEEAYYRGLMEGVADPTFSEAVIRWRSRRQPPRPVREPPPGGPDTDGRVTVGRESDGLATDDAETVGAT